MGDTDFSYVELQSQNLASKSIKGIHFGQPKEYTGRKQAWSREIREEASAVAQAG